MGACSSLLEGNDYVGFPDSRGRGGRFVACSEYGNEVPDSLEQLIKSNYSHIAEVIPIMLKGSFFARGVEFRDPPYDYNALWGKGLKVRRRVPVDHVVVLRERVPVVKHLVYCSAHV